MSLVKYIEKYGTPDAVFFSFEEKKHYALWGFDDIYSISKDEIDNDNNSPGHSATGVSEMTLSTSFLRSFPHFSEETD